MHPRKIYIGTDDSKAGFEKYKAEYMWAYAHIGQCMLNAHNLGYDLPQAKEFFVRFSADTSTYGQISTCDNDKYTITIDPGLIHPPEMIGAVISHEMAHFYLRHLEHGQQLLKNQTREREAIRLSLKLFPNPKAHIERRALIYRHKEYVAEVLQHDAEEVSDFWKRTWLEADAEQVRSSHLHGRTHPSYGSFVYEIVQGWKALAAEGKCEPVDYDYLRSLPKELRGYINHDICQARQGGVARG